MPHPQMLFDIEECEQLSSIPNKTTVCITTSQSHINFLMWSIFSVLLRSKVGGFLEHINVAINGPDERCGDPSLQNLKQNFLEDLRSLRWQSEVNGLEIDMPLTINRVWSRVGAEQSLEMLLPWVHTDSYIYLHDDTLWNTKNWEATVMRDLYKDNVAIVYAKPFIMSQLGWSEYENNPKLNMPHVINHCLICRKPILAKCGVKWTGYHFANEFDLKEKIKNMELFFSGHRPNVSPIQLEKKYKSISYDVGAWAYYTLKKQGYEINPVSELSVHHFTSMSWSDKKDVVNKIESNKKIIENLENEIKQFPKYWRLYLKYKSEII